MWKKFALLAALTLLLMGCGKYDAKVSGTVKYDGGLLDRGTVLFYPTSGGASAYGRIQPDGSFEIKTGDDQGLSAGDYRVAVTSVERIPAETKGDTPRAKTLIPLDFKDAQKSGLSFTVAKGGNKFDIELPKKGN